MSKIVQFLFLLVLSCSAYSQDAIEKLIAKQEQSQIVTDWVMEHSPKIVTREKAEAIVKNAAIQSINNDIDMNLILALIKRESGFVHTAQSKYGAKGLMQVVPRWHRDKLKFKDPKQIDVSIDVGTTILKDCLIAKGNDYTKALSCYSGYTTKTVTKYRNDIFATMKDITTYVKVQTSNDFAFSNNYSSVQSFE